MRNVTSQNSSTVLMYVVSEKMWHARICALGFIIACAGLQGGACFPSPLATSLEKNLGAIMCPCPGPLLSHRTARHFAEKILLSAVPCERDTLSQERASETRVPTLAPLPRAPFKILRAFGGSSLAARRFFSPGSRFAKAVNNDSSVRGRPCVRWR